MLCGHRNGRSPETVGGSTGSWWLIVTLQCMVVVLIGIGKALPECRQTGKQRECFPVIIVCDRDKSHCKRGVVLSAKSIFHRFLFVLAFTYPWKYQCSDADWHGIGLCVRVTWRPLTVVFCVAGERSVNPSILLEHYWLAGWSFMIELAASRRHHSKRECTIRSQHPRSTFPDDGVVKEWPCVFYE